MASGSWTGSGRSDVQDALRCASGWDGSFRPLVEQTKARMREPGSFKHIETRFVPRVSEPGFAVRMDYSGRNGFGGVSVETAYALMDESCRMIPE